MKFLFIIDPIHTLDVHHDTTIGIMEAVFARHEQLWVTEPALLSIESGDPLVLANRTQVALSATPWYHLEPTQQYRLCDFDIILMRKDPPFDMDYIFTTHILDLAHHQGVLVSNHPQSLRDFNEKLILNYFPELTTPYLVSSKTSTITAFINEYRDTVIKPLDSMGGHSIFRLKSQDEVTSTIEQMTNQQQRPILIMPYIDKVTEGDKRIILLNGVPCEHALLRVPPKGQLLANIAAGGTGHVVPITERDREICAAVKPFCQQHGLHLVGLDVIGTYLTEINITSPTCLREIEQHSQRHYAMTLIEQLEKAR